MPDSQPQCEICEALIGLKGQEAAYFYQGQILCPREMKVANSEFKEQIDQGQRMIPHMRQRDRQQEINRQTLEFPNRRRKEEEV